MANQERERPQSADGRKRWESDGERTVTGYGIKKVFMIELTLSFIN